MKNQFILFEQQKINLFHIFIAEMIFTGEIKAGGFTSLSYIGHIETDMESDAEYPCKVNVNFSDILHKFNTRTIREARQLVVAIHNQLRE